MTDRDLWDAKPAPPHERLARIEGQSNFLSLLAGVEAGPDTTQDMGALSFSRGYGAMPEVLECHVAQSELFKLPLMSLVFDAVKAEMSPPEKDWPWVQGAIADAFLLLRTGHCKPLQLRARRFRVDISAYSAMRKLAHGVLLEWLSRAERGWYSASKSGATKDRHDVGGRVNKRHVAGQPHCGYREMPLPDSDEQFAASYAYQGKQPGVPDRLGWDDRNAAPSEVSAGTASAPLEQAKGKP
jgi:hypothetical protein